MPAPMTMVSKSTASIVRGRHAPDQGGRELRLVLPPPPDRARVDRIVSVGVEAEPAADPALAAELVRGQALDEREQALVHGLLLREHLGESEILLLVRHAGVELVDTD